MTTFARKTADRKLAQARRAALYVCGRLDRDGARDVLAALGLDHALRETHMDDEHTPRCLHETRTPVDWEPNKHIVWQCGAPADGAEFCERHTEPDAVGTA